jgi:arsenate reductase
MTLTLWHNPRCTKSRAALALLQDRGLHPRVRLYLDDPPSVAELAGALSLLGRPARDLLRWSEPEAKSLSPDAPDAELIAAMAAHPRLIERPLLISDRAAAIGRPTEALLPLLPAP